MDTFLEIMQLMRKVSNGVENVPNCFYLDFFLGEGQQSSHGGSDGAWIKITNAKEGVTEKVLRTFGIQEKIFLHYRGTSSSNFTKSPLVG